MFNDKDSSLIHDVALIQSRRKNFFSALDPQVIRASELKGSVERGIHIAQMLTKQDNEKNRYLCPDAVEGTAFGCRVSIDPDDLTDKPYKDVQFILTTQDSSLADKPVKRDIISTELNELCGTHDLDASIVLIFVTA